MMRRRKRQQPTTNHLPQHFRDFFVSLMMHGTARELFVHKNSDTIYLQGTYRAVFSLLPPWSTGLFGTATAIYLERLYPSKNKTTRRRRVVKIKQCAFVLAKVSCKTACALVVGPHSWDLGLLSCQTLLFKTGCSMMQRF
jgi:hypothetical protein